jgi:hypothetical protein
MTVVLTAEAGIGDKKLFSAASGGKALATG